MSIKYSVRFVLHKERNDIFSVRMRFAIRGDKTFDYSIGQTLPSHDYWNDDTQRAIRSYKKSREVNTAIEEAVSVISDIIAKYEHVEKRDPQTKDVKREFFAMYSKTAWKEAQKAREKEDLFFIFDMFCDTVGASNQWTHATRAQYEVLKRMLQEYQDVININSVDTAFMNGFVKHLTEERNLKNTTNAKTIKFLRMFLKWANENGFYDGHMHNYKAKLKGSNFEQKEVIFLTKEELLKVEKFEFDRKNRHLERLRDVFVFCCFTGLRFSDVAKLKKNDIHDGYISVVTKKTSDLLRIQLNSHAKAILDKYADTELKKGNALPTISNQKSNINLRKVGKLCGLNTKVRIVFFQGNQRVEEVYEKWELLTTHVARKTFVVTALQLGIDPTVIMKFTGHSDYKAMKPYVKIVEQLKEDAMNKFDML